MGTLILVELLEYDPYSEDIWFSQDRVFLVFLPQETVATMYGKSFAPKIMIC